MRRDYLSARLKRKDFSGTIILNHNEAPLKIQYLGRGVIMLDLSEIAKNLRNSRIGGLDSSVKRGQHKKTVCHSGVT